MLLSIMGGPEQETLPGVDEDDTSETLDLDTLESHLWEAADILRGSIDAADYKNYIFGLLFLKRINDRFDKETEEIAEEYDVDEEAVRGERVPRCCVEAFRDCRFLNRLSRTRDIGQDFGVGSGKEREKYFSRYCYANSNKPVK